MGNVDTKRRKNRRIKVSRLSCELVIAAILKVQIQIWNASRWQVFQRLVVQMIIRLTFRRRDAFIYSFYACARTSTEDNFTFRLAFSFIFFDCETSGVSDCGNPLTAGMQDFNERYNSEQQTSLSAWYLFTAGRRKTRSWTNVFACVHADQSRSMVLGVNNLW